MRFELGMLLAIGLSGCGLNVDETGSVSAPPSHVTDRSPERSALHPAQPMAGWPLAFGSTTHVMLRDGDPNHHFVTGLTRYADGSGGVVSLVDRATGAIEHARAIARGRVAEPAGPVDSGFAGADRGTAVLDVTLPGSATPTTGTLVLQLDADRNVRARLVLPGDDSSGRASSDWVAMVPVDAFLCIDDGDCALEGFDGTYSCGPANTCLPRSTTPR